MKKSDETKPRSFLSVVEDEVISDPGFPIPVIRSCPYPPDPALFAEVLSKHPAHRAPQPGHAFQLSFKWPFHKVALPRVSRELQYLIRVNISDSLGYAREQRWTLEPRATIRARAPEAEMEKHAPVLPPLRPARKPPSHSSPTLSLPETPRDSLLLLPWKGKKTEE